MYVDLAGLARYKSDFDAWARGRLLPKDAAAARVRTAKAGAVSLVPVQETPLDVSVDFLFTETPPASGDKSPSNPSTISGVSSVKVTRCGKNFAPVNTNASTSGLGVAFTQLEDGGYRIVGTPSTNVHYNIISDYSFIIPANTTLVVSLKSTSHNAKVSFQAWPRSGSSYFAVSTGDSVTITANDETRYANIRLTVLSDAGALDMVVYPQIEVGNTETVFEKPIFNDYTLPLNGTFYGGTLDVATGVMTVAWAGKEITGTENWFLASASTSEVNEFYVGADSGFLPMNNTISSATRSCSHFRLGNANLVADTFYTWGSATRVMFRKSVSDMADVAAFKSWLALQYANATPVTITYMLATPIVVQLTLTEILSLTQSSDYDPRVNTVYSDAQAVQVGYLKHPSAASADLRNALVSLGGGV